MSDFPGDCRAHRVGVLRMHGAWDEGLWQEVEASYEIARARLLLAEALASGGDVEGGAAEARAARTIFERLGTHPDINRAQEIQSRASAGKDEGHVEARERRPDPLERKTPGCMSFRAFYVVAAPSRVFIAPFLPC